FPCKKAPVEPSDHAFHTLFGWIGSRYVRHEVEAPPATFATGVEWAWQVRWAALKSPPQWVQLPPGPLNPRSVVQPGPSLQGRGEPRAAPRLNRSRTRPWKHRPDLLLRKRFSIMVSMNRLTGEKRTMIVASLVEGNSINATCRMAGVSKNTVLKLLGDLGLICSIHQDRLLRNLTCERVQVDEIWSFVYAKQKNVPAEKRGEAGDVWLWTAIDADTKLVPTYRLGPRDMRTAVDFIGDLEKRLANRIQLTSDGWHLYLKAVGA